jgi:uncharacterized membrane protein
MTAGNHIKNITASARLRSPDILRGVVMILMAIDHVRVYSGLPAGGSSAGIFFTRWITHFCAPAFVFFAGTAAFLYGQKNNRQQLAVYLVTRGLLLVVLELTLIRFCWTFSFDYSEFILAGVIWMLGWCMVLLAAFIWLSPAITGITGLIIIFFQQAFALVHLGKGWEFIYPAGSDAPGGMTILYVLVPWIGVMAAGYGFGTLLLTNPELRKKICLRIGLSSIAAFIITASIILSRKPAGPEAPAFIFRLLNQTKYPASPLYLLMTLGPVIAMVPFAEKARGWLADLLARIGRVPMFYYLLHIPLIHITALAVNYIRTGHMHMEWYVHAPYSFVPPEQQWSLGMLYLVFLIDIIVLYFACNWYSRYKFQHPGKKWLKYL